MPEANEIGILAGIFMVRELPSPSLSNDQAHPDEMRE
jgi:hypothetical protein